MSKVSDKVQVGKTELFVTPIGLGTNAVGGHNIWPDLDEEAGKNLVRTAIDHGINLIDTAFIYGPERSEELVGEVVKESGKRQDLVLATKGAHRFAGSDIVFDNSPSFLKQAVEGSLKRLGVDTIDLFYIHFPDKDTPKNEAVGALKELKDQGKIRAIGVSNFSLEQLKEANEDGYVDVFQGEYNLLKRGAEKDLFPYLKEHHISFVPYFPLASGLLTGKFTRETTFTDNRAKMPQFQKGVYEKNLEKVDKLRAMAQLKHTAVPNLVLAWYLKQDVIDVVIPGAKRSEQVLDNLKTLDVRLSDKEFEAINKIFN